MCLAQILYYTKTRQTHTPVLKHHRLLHLLVDLLHLIHDGLVADDSVLVVLEAVQLVLQH